MKLKREHREQLLNSLTETEEKINTLENRLSNDKLKEWFSHNQIELFLELKRRELIGTIIIENEIDL